MEICSQKVHQSLATPGISHTIHISVVGARGSPQRRECSTKALWEQLEELC